MIVIALESDPLRDVSYEQGLDIAMTLADLEQEVKVVILGAFAAACAKEDAHAVFRKKLLQLDLFDIECISAIDTTDEKSGLTDSRAIISVLNEAQRILTF
ncbi:MAG: hypothetical protein J6M93_01270 [Succinivibrio sp.]|nr:hypothetical protein [Succinivibrio sp.]